MKNEVYRKVRTHPLVTSQIENQTLNLSGHRDEVGKAILERGMRRWVQLVTRWITENPPEWPDEFAIDVNWKQEVANRSEAVILRRVETLGGWQVCVDWFRGVAGAGIRHGETNFRVRFALRNVQNTVSQCAMLWREEIDPEILRFTSEEASEALMQYVKMTGGKTTIINLVD